MPRSGELAFSAVRTDGFWSLSPLHGNGEGHHLYVLTRFFARTGFHPYGSRPRGHASLENALAGDDLDRSVVIAMIAMRMMKPAVHEVIDVIAVRNGLMPAVGTMNMAGVVAHMTKLRRATVGIFGADVDGVLLNGVAGLMVQMAVMQVVDMIAVFDPDVAA